MTVPSKESGSSTGTSGGSSATTGEERALSVDVTATFTASGAEPFTVDAAFDVDPGETVVVLGPSGSGKTLLLETVAGFHSHEGSVALDDRDVTDEPPETREFGFVFQDYGLFPHMTVAENVRFGEPYHDETGDAGQLLADLGIADLAERSPETLSGGEKQRVALARSLYVRPGVLLLDEPLSSLDVPTRARLRRDMAGVLDGVTAVYVTHDRTTARTLADRVVVMNGGEVVQRGSVADVFERPSSPFVAEFTGSNCLSLSTDGIREAVGVNGGGGEAADESDGADGAVAESDGPVGGNDGADDAEWLAVRPEHLSLAPVDGVDPRENGDGRLRATVEYVVREDAAYRVSLSVDGQTLDALTTDPPEVGERVAVTFDEDARTLL